MKKFNQKKKNDISNEGEAVRLSNELRNYKEKIVKDIHGEIINIIPEKTNGFDIETASFQTITEYLENNNTSKVLECFIHRILSNRFPNEYKNYNVNNEFTQEKDLIIENSKNDVNWFGEVSYFGKTRLDKSIDNKKQSFKATII